MTIKSEREKTKKICDDVKKKVAELNAICKESRIDRDSKISDIRKAAAEKKAAEKKRKLRIETKCAYKSSKSSNEFSAREIYTNCLQNNNYWKE